MAGARSRTALRRKSEITRRRILDAATERFAAVGYDGVTTREIAGRARVNQGLVTYYFGSKDQLWREVVERLFADLHAVFESAVAETPRGSELRAVARDVVRRYVRFCASHPELHRIITQEGKLGGPRMRWLVDRHVRPFYDTARAFLTSLQEASIAPSAPIAHVLYAIVGAGTHVFTVGPEFRRITGTDPADPAVIEAHADTLVALLLP